MSADCPAFVPLFFKACTVPFCAAFEGVGGFVVHYIEHMLIIAPAWRAVNRLLRREIAINIFLQAAEGNPVGISYAFAVDCVCLQQAVGFLPSNVQDLPHGFDVYDVWVFLSQV